MGAPGFEPGTSRVRSEPSVGRRLDTKVLRQVVPRPRRHWLLVRGRRAADGHSDARTWTRAGAWRPAFRAEGVSEMSGLKYLATRRAGPVAIGRDAAPPLRAHPRAHRPVFL